MILQSLCDYYRRQQDELPPPGFERKAIPFVIVLNHEGQFIDIEDTRNNTNDKRDKGKLFKVPQGAANRTSGIVPNLLWDRTDYALGIVTEARTAKLQGVKKQKEEGEIPRRHQAFVQRIRDTFPNPGIDDGVKAVLTFLDCGDFGAVLSHPYWADLTKSVEPLSFRLNGDQELICQRESVQRTLVAASQDEIIQSRCLVSGQSDAIALLHPIIKGVYGGNAKSSGAKLISFNFDAACSYGKKQGMNSPVGESAVFAYTTALNTLLRTDSRQKISIGADTFVFWAEKPNPAEELFAAWLQPDPDDPARGAEAVKVLYKAPQTGVRPLDQDHTRFFVLGLAPNVARLSVRLWSVTTVWELAANIRQHFDDLAIVHSDRDPEYLSLWRLLKATAAQDESKNIPPLLTGEVLRAILAGTPYPQTLLAATLQRIHAEQGHVSYPRAALIKAVLVRNARFYSSNVSEVTVSLDLENLHVGYRLGRLFAVLEKVQEEAHPGLNATIRDRFYGAASSTPITVFSNLMKLNKHHLAKIEHKGRAVNLEKLIGEIIDGLTDSFPAQLPMIEQGRFAIGYYHQKQAFYKKSISDQEQ